MRLMTPAARFVWSRGVFSGAAWRVVLGVGLCVLALGSSASGNAPAASPSPRPKKGNPPTVAAQRPPGHQPEMAVVYDDAYRPPAKDLLLGLEAERKSEANAHFMLGLILEETSTSASAHDEYLKALALDPANARLSVKVAWEYLAQGDTPGAINLLKDTIKAAPKQSQPYLALAYLYFNNMNRAGEAQKYAQQAIDLDPANIFGYAYLREVYKATGQENKVPTLLDRAAKVESRDAFFWLQLGALYAEVFLTDDGGKDPEALKKTTQIFQKALTFSNEDVDVIEKIADFFVATQQLAEAAPLYQRVVELDSSRNTARDSLARCYIGLKQPEKAASALEDSIKQNPVQPHAYEVLAEIYKNAGQEEKAIRNYEQSLLLNPRDPEGYKQLAILLLDHKHAELAVKITSEARKHFPSEPLFMWLHALALEQSKQHQPAMVAFEQAELGAQSDRPTMLAGQFYLQYGETAEQAGLYEKAASMLQKAISLTDDQNLLATASNDLGYMWVDHDLHLDDGGDLIKKALEIDPENGAFLDSLGWYYYKKNEFALAVENLKKAIEKTKPEDPTVFEHLGDTYLKLNDTARAVENWKKAVDLDPAGPNVTGLNKKITDSKPAAAQASPTPGPTAPPKS